jgi:hypothetical protein
VVWPTAGVVHAEVVADRAHHHFAGVEADADADVQRVAALHLITQAAHCQLHSQCRVAGAERVVLVGERGAEQRHDAVAHDLVDGAVVAVHRLHHAGQHGVEHPARLLGVPVSQELHRPLEVGEQHRHLFPLALQRGSGPEDLLGDVLGCVVGG